MEALRGCWGLSRYFREVVIGRTAADSDSTPRSDGALAESPEGVHRLSDVFEHQPLMAKVHICSARYGRLQVLQ